MAGEGTNRESVRRRNLATVLGHVHRAGRLSRSALTNSTGLNRSTVGTLVADLAARGLVEEVEAVSSGTPGRPSPLVRPRHDRVVVFAADIWVGTISFAVAGLGGKLLYKQRVPHPPERRSPEATVHDLTELIDKALVEIGNGHTVLAMGVSVTGVVRSQDGFVHTAPNIGWRDVPLAEMLHTHLADRLPVFVGNEADLGATAEHVRGAGVGVDNLIYVSSEIGVGGGIIIDGRPLAGAAGYGGEIGHMTVNPAGEPCRCGNVGCWETETGQRALLRRIGRSNGNEQDAVDAVLREAAAGSRRTLEALEHIGHWLGLGLAGLVNIFNPSRIVLGGMFAQAYPYLADAIRRELDRRALAPARGEVTVVSASLGEDSALLGAVELAFSPLLADPTIMPLPGEDREMPGRRSLAATAE